MTNYNFNLGTTYKFAHINTALETIPSNPVFKSLKDEVFFYEPQKRVSYSQVMFNIQQGYVNNFDLKVLSLIATFGSVCMTTKALKTLFYMNGEDLGSQDHRLTNALYRLGQNNLITFGHFKAPEKKNASLLRIICLTGYGSKVARSMGVSHRFNPLEVLDAPTAKSRAQTSMLITNFIMNLSDDIENFEVRPVLLRKEVHPDAIVRPAAKICMFGEDIYFEVPRSGKANHLEDLVDKLRRYTLVFDELPSVVINGEDEQMNRCIYEYLSTHCTEHGFNLSNILFTDDLAQFGARFNTCLYSFDENSNKACFEFTPPAKMVA